MKKYLYFLLLSVFINTSLFSNEDLNVSIKTYKNVDEQKIFNLIKRIYREDSKNYIIDTSWNELHIMKRSAYTFFTIGMQIDNLVLSVVPSEDKNTTQMQLEIFSTIDDDKNLVAPDNLAHKIFWNRVDYALGLDENWISCNELYGAPYCSVSKDELVP